MKGQSSVLKRIIWALCTVVLCTFLAFFMSMFLGSAFPNLNVIYKAGIPALIFVLLGVASLGIKNFLIPFLEDLSVPQVIKNILPLLLIGLGVLFGQFSFDQYSDTALKTEVFQKFILTGKIYETVELSFQSVYQSGLNVVSILLGRTVFAVSFYNRCLLVIIAILLYFTLKNICQQKSFAANLFLILFFCSKQTMELAVRPEAALIYGVLVSAFLFSASLVYRVRTTETNPVRQVISVFVMGCLFAILLLAETNSVIFAFPSVLVSFSGKYVQDKRWYYILAVEGMILILITCTVIFAMKPELLLNLSFELPAINVIDLKITTLLVLNVLGILGVFGMCNQKIYYIIPAVMGIYFMFANADFVSGINSEIPMFMCFALYAALGVGLLDNSELIIEKIKEIKKITEQEENVKSVETQVESPVLEITAEKSVSMSESEAKTEEQKEIDKIKELNIKLNTIEKGFVPKTFKQPKTREKKTFEYAYEPTTEEMKYDLEVSDDDDFDI